MSHTYTVVLRREPEGSYTVVVPALRGCLTSGDTVDEALDNAREVIPAFLEVMREDGEGLELVRSAALNSTKLGEWETLETTFTTHTDPRTTAIYLYNFDDTQPAWFDGLELEEVR